MTVNDLLRQRVRRRAKSLCEYCHSPESISATRFTIDHTYPRSLGGSDNFENLALACSRCNQRRYNFITGRDQKTSSIATLYNPRKQSWVNHFVWSVDTTRIIGTSSTGRATCDRLDINDDRYRGDHPITEVRLLWQQVGWHPPDSDPVQSEESSHR